MTGSTRVALWSALCWLTVSVALWQEASAQTDAKTPITAANAKDVRRIGELDRKVYRIVRGPGRGEVTLFDYGAPADVVDDVNFRPLRILAEKAVVFDLSLSRDARFVAWQPGPHYVVQDIAKNTTSQIDPGPHPGGSALSPDGKLLAIGTASAVASDIDDGSCEMKLWDNSGRLVRTLEGSKQGYLTPAFSPDGKTLAVGNRNYETRLFDVETGKLLHTLPRRMTHEIAFSPDGKMLAACYVDGAVVIWNVSNGTELKSMRNVAKEIYTVDWSPKGDLLVTAGFQGKITLWNPNNMAALKELDSANWISSVRFTADGTRLLSSGGPVHDRADRKVVIWSVRDEIEK